MNERNLSILLTYQCSRNCRGCVEQNLHKKGFMTNKIFNKALKWAKENGIKEILLHGGEPTLHPNIIKFAKKAKRAGFKIKMYTNYDFPEVVKELDGILDEILISYYNQKNLPKQSDFKTRLTLTTLVYKSRFSTKEDFDKFIDSKQDLGMKLVFNTLKPSTQWAANNMVVDYLEDIFLQTEEKNIFLSSGKRAINYRGCKIKFNNKKIFNLPRWNITVNGEIRDGYNRKVFKPLINESNISVREKNRNNITSKYPKIAIEHTNINESQVFNKKLDNTHKTI